MKFLSRFSVSVLTALLIISGQAPSALAQGTERIIEFVIDVNVKSDGEVQFVETITYDFSNESRHGIFREIPVRDKLDSGKFWVHPVSINSVTRDGSNEMYSESEDGTWASVKIGDPDIFLSGVHTYVIDYTVSGALFPLSASDVSDYPNLSAGDISFYWDVIGNSWLIPIDQVVVNINLPSTDNTLVLAENCMVGTPKDETQCWSMSSRRAWATTEVMQPGEAMTISMQMNPAMFDRKIKQEIDEGPLEVFSSKWLDIVKAKLLLGGLLGATVFSLIIFMWRKRINRTKNSKVSEVLQFDAPAGHVAEIAAAWKGSVDSRALTATLLDLAARGKVEVHVNESDNLVIKNLDKEIKLENYEQEILDVLFRDSNEAAIAGYDSELARVTGSVSSSLVEKAELTGFRNKSGSRNRIPFIVGLFLSIIFFVISLVTLAIPEMFGVAVPVALAMLIGFIFTAVKTPRIETPESAAFLSHLLGFRKAMDTDSGALRRKFAQKSGLSAGNIFATFLPFAIIFELEDSWLANFPDLTLEEIRSSGIYIVSLGSLHNSIQNSHEAFAAAMTPPDSSGSGSGGGGSGGGGGGGGGGSW
jgi:uncharacterized membrane protein